MTVHAGSGSKGMPNCSVAAAFRLGALATMLAAVSACGQGGRGREDVSIASPPVMSSGGASVNGGSDRLRIGIEAWGESGPVAETSLTRSEWELPARQIAACWSPPVGGTDSGESAVQLKLSMNRDGTAQRLEVIDQGKMAESQSLRTLAESAIKAVMRCMPLKLPPDKYDQWRVFVIYFDAGFSAKR